ncbi:MAG: hypothetical protein IT433_05605 [Phycisphaerales bacterium]|nr:hypothetical protein [Phycisphaerales bacterium]
MPEPALPQVTALPSWLLRTVGATSGLLAIWAAVMAVLASIVAPRPAWVLFGFEVVVVAAGVIGVGFSRRRFQEGQGLALTCVAGAVFASAVLSWLGNRQGVTLIETRGQASLLGFAAVRVGVAGLFALAAAYAVLRRTAQARAYALRAGVALLALGGLGAAFWMGRQQIGALAPFVGGAIKLLALTIGMILVCAGGHCAIRAFESGRTQPEGA